ncbi:MAG: hypothetical protein IKD04_00480 [Clostridia bacterium]|nr:hypothetical protein [Clostridia bacterium]
MPENLHKDHRQRMVKEFLSKGIENGTPPHKIMEMLLFYSIPRKDTNEIAHRLINRFKSFSGVFDADIEELMQVEGVGERTAVFLKLISTASRQYLSDQYKPKDLISDNMSRVCNYIMGRYTGYTKEAFAVTTFDRSGKLIKFDMLGQGDVDAVNVSIREIIELVIKRNATAVILSHNHPDGFAIPSESDKKMTQRICGVLNNIRVKLIDHIVISDGDYVSMWQTEADRWVFNPEKE